MFEEAVELSDIIPFKQEGQWYLRFIYKYEDKRGKHTVIIPKAAVPFPQRSLPSINNWDPYFHISTEVPYISCNDAMFLHEAVCGLAIERGVTKPACYFDIITEYAAKEMTLEEIEKELGYKVKIINKESK